MSEKFYTILTNIGKSKIANFGINGEKVKFVKLKVGDGNGKYYNPTEDQIDLLNTVWEGKVGNIESDKNNPNWIIIETIIPPEVGDFTIREYGVFDEDNNLLAIAKCAETYKPLISNGSTKELIIKMILSVSNTESISFEVDPNIMLAKKSEVNEINTKVNDATSQLNEKANLSDVKIFKSLSDIGLSATDMTTDLASNLLKIITAAGANRQISLYPYESEINNNLYTSIKTWCGFNTDAYHINIYTSINGKDNVPSKIEVIPNYNTGNNKMFIGFYDNALGSAQEVATRNRIDFTLTPKAGYKFISQNNYRINYVLFFNFRIAKTDDTTFAKGSYEAIIPPSGLLTNPSTISASGMLIDTSWTGDCNCVISPNNNIIFVCVNSDNVKQIMCSGSVVI